MGLTTLKELFNSLALPIVITGPGAISTDCDQALRNALKRVFPDSPTLLCSWHANKNIQQHCRSYFTTEETWERFIQGWNSIVGSKTEEEYESRHTQFQTILLVTLPVFNILIKPGYALVGRKP